MPEQYIEITDEKGKPAIFPVSSIMTVYAEKGTGRTRVELTQTTSYYSDMELVDIAALLDKKGHFYALKQVRTEEIVIVNVENILYLSGGGNLVHVHYRGYPTPMIRSYEHSYEQISAILSVLADNGEKGSATGTILDAMYRDLKNSVEDGNVAIGDTSVALYDSEGNMRAMTDVLADVERATIDMTGAERDDALGAVFQQQAIGGVNILLGEGTDAIYDYEKGLYASEGAAQSCLTIYLVHWQA